MKIASELRIPFTWENRHPVMLDHFLYIPGYFSSHESWQVIPWCDLNIFGNHQPVSVEFCSGNGQWICSKAKSNPHLNWVAVEKRFDRARKIWASMKRENISNLFVVCAEALTYTKYYVPKNSISEIYVNFPDPWPKLRHAKHRLISLEFLQAIRSISKGDTKGMFTTDDEPYRDLMIESLKENPDWILMHLPNHYTSDIEDFGDSYFKALWKAKGKNIYHIQFKATP